MSVAVLSWPSTREQPRGPLTGIASRIQYAPLAVRAHLPDDGTATRPCVAAAFDEFSSMAK